MSWRAETNIIAVPVQVCPKLAARKHRHTAQICAAKKRSNERNNSRHYVRIYLTYIILLMVQKS